MKAVIAARRVRARRGRSRISMLLAEEPKRIGLAQMEQESDAGGQQQHQDHAPESSLV